MCWGRGGGERQVELGEWEGRDYHISLYTSMKFLKVKKKILKLPISLKKKISDSITFLMYTIPVSSFNFV